MNQITIYTDGGARGNPGPAGIGVVICDSKDKCQKYSRYIGKATNNQAEYRALIFALEKAQRLNPQKIICYLDSELVVRQLNRIYKVKDKGLKPLSEEIKRLVSRFKNIHFRHVLREKNKQADKLVNRAINKAIAK